jgi:hypothetical protein
MRRLILLALLGLLAVAPHDLAASRTHSSTFDGFAGALFPRAGNVQFAFRRAPLPTGQPPATAGLEWPKIRSGATAFYAERSIGVLGPPPGTPWADVVVYVFETVDDARAAYRRSQGASSQPHVVTRTREGGTIGVSLGINVAGEAYASVRSVFRNVLSFSMGGGVVPSYTNAEAGRDGVRIHRAIHRRAIALSS